MADVVIGMPHRGRLNAMTVLMQYPAAAIFHKLSGKRELPAGSQGTADVLSHLYQSVDLDVNGKKLHLSLLPNPSHLEVWSTCTSMLQLKLHCKAINPVTVGKVRARQDYYEQKLDVVFVINNKSPLR